MHHQQTNTEQAQVQTDNKTWANAITEPIATERTAQKGQNPNSKSALEAASPNSVLNVIVYGLTRIELCWNVTTMRALYIYIFNILHYITYNYDQQWPVKTPNKFETTLTNSVFELFQNLRHYFFAMTHRSSREVSCHRSPWENSWRPDSRQPFVIAEKWRNPCWKSWRSHGDIVIIVIYKLYVYG